MNAFPLRFAHQNLLVGNGDTHAGLYRVGCISYPFMATADKREWLGRLARFAYVVGADFSLWRVNRAYPAEGYVEQAERLLDPRRQDRAAWRSYLAGHEAHLRTLRSSSRRSTSRLPCRRSVPCVSAPVCSPAWTAPAGAWRACSASAGFRRSLRRSWMR